MADPGASPPPRAEGVPPAGRGSGGGCLPLLLFLAALWFWFGPWNDLRERTRALDQRVVRQEQRTDSLRAALDSLAARRAPAPAGSAATPDSAGARW